MCNILHPQFKIQAKLRVIMIKLKNTIANESKENTTENISPINFKEKSSGNGNHRANEQSSPWKSTIFDIGNREPLAATALRDLTVCLVLEQAI